MRADNATEKSNDQEKTGKGILHNAPTGDEMSFDEAV
jgi:hypothetical protein